MDECERCKNWLELGLSDTCPSCRIKAAKEPNREHVDFMTGKRTHDE